MVMAVMAGEAASARRQAGSKPRDGAAGGGRSPSASSVCRASAHMEQLLAQEAEMLKR